MRSRNKNQKTQQDGEKFKIQRRGLLAKLHIAIQELSVSDADYREILKDSWGVSSAGELSINELEEFVERCKKAGWKPRHTKELKKKQIVALRGRAREIAEESNIGKTRMRGLAKKILGVEALEWTQDINALKRFLAALQSIGQREKTGKNSRIKE